MRAVSGNGLLLLGLLCAAAAVTCRADGSGQPRPGRLARLAVQVLSPFVHQQQARAPATQQQPQAVPAKAQVNQPAKSADHHDSKASIKQEAAPSTLQTMTLLPTAGAPSMFADAGVAAALPTDPLTAKQPALSAEIPATAPAAMANPYAAAGAVGTVPDAVPTAPAALPVAAAVPSAFPAALPQQPAYAGALPTAFPGAVPGATPGALPGAVPGAFPGAVPGAFPGAVPGAFPGAVPAALPGADPSLALQPGAAPGVPGIVPGVPQLPMMPGVMPGVPQFPGAAMPAAFPTMPPTELPGDGQMGRGGRTVIPGVTAIGATGEDTTAAGTGLGSLMDPSASSAGSASDPFAIATGSMTGAQGVLGQGTSASAMAGMTGGSSTSALAQRRQSRATNSSSSYKLGTSLAGALLLLALLVL